MAGYLIPLVSSTKVDDGLIRVPLIVE
ncbi:uncharacterized protein METZ01_LOCUS157224 [marine metagenome]|uniref:Uncharacterized protein n=1 Tax=marine metagenome TaxID=408172 RepID=A0A382AS51_9ZZZZ